MAGRKEASHFTRNAAVLSHPRRWSKAFGARAVRCHAFETPAQPDPACDAPQAVSASLTCSSRT
eukprot:75882-Hanusia_phi.AAC.3